MSQNEAKVRHRPEDADGASDASFSSLSKTLEDLEKRLSRLSSSKPVASASSVQGSEDAELSASEKLRLAAEARRARRPSLTAAVSNVAVERALASEEDAPRRRAAAGRRIGTIAAEVEQLQLQNASIALIKDLAAELTLLRGDIQSRVGADTDGRMEELQTSFADLKQMIAERDAPERIGAEIYEIMESLTELTAGTADQASLEALRGELDAVAAMVGQMAREESLEAVKARWDAFETRISEHVALDAEAKRNLKVELERLRTSLRSLATEDQVLAVQQRWEEFEARYLDTARVQAEESVAKVLRTELNGLREKLDAIVAENGKDALDARFEALAERLDPGELEAGIERLAERMQEIESALVRMPEFLQIEQLEARVADLAEGIDILMREVREPDLSQFVLLEERLADISAALANAPVQVAAQIDMAPVERIEARVADLSGRIDRLADGRNVEALSSQIAALAERVEDIGAARPADDLGQRIDTLAERVESLFRSAGGADTSAFEERLTAIAQRLEDSASARAVDPEVIAALETQITRMTQILAGVPAGASIEDAGVVTQRLDAIERQLDENRDNVVAAARAAAEEAVRRMQGEDARRESGFVQELAQDMRNLEALCRESDERTFGVFDAVHATLIKIVERLTVIEQEMRGRPVETVAAPVLRPAAMETVAAPALAPATPPSAEIAPAVPPADVSVFAERSVQPGTAVDEEARGLRAALQRHISRRGGKAKAEAAPSLAERIRPTPIVEEPARELEQREDAPKAAMLAAPELDPSDSLISREANRPLEPGSGAPDIAALIERVRQQQRGEDPAPEPMAKADFIAAARKAAMAAAAEAESLRDRQERGEDLAGKPASNRRKPILMGVGAVLLALMAVPFGIDRLMPKEPHAANVDESTVAAVAPMPEASFPSATAAAEPTDAARPAEPAAPAPVASAVPAEMSAPTMAVAPTSALAPTIPDAASAPAEVAEAMPMDTGIEAGVPIAAAAVSEAAQPEGAASAPSAPAPAAIDAGAILASVRSRLPEAARGAIPALPEGIASDALTKAVGAEDPKALFEIGLRVMEGRNGPSDPATALNWFAQSASRGFAPAQYSLGTLFEKGNGVARDAAMARDWYLLAADQGNVRAMHNLAVLYATGIDGKSEPADAARWFIHAADHGMRDSQYNLGILYARGAGVEQDLAQSYRWFGIVAGAGDKDAASKMQEVGKTLSAEQRQSLDAEIAAWKAEPRVEAANTVEVPPDWSETAGRTASVDMTRAVRNVQAILIKLGYDPGQPDGKVGARTEAAIRQFQGKSGLAATGKIDEPLIRALLERKDA